MNTQSCNVPSLSVIECVGGIQLQYGNSVITNSIARVTSSFIGTGGAKFITAKESGYVDSVCLGVYKTATPRELGGYEDISEYVSEDSFISKRIRKVLLQFVYTLHGLLVFCSFF